MKEYNEEEFLALSGIQHFIFCRRQWALIHLEQQWEENVRTVEGRIMHERAHDGQASETRNGVRIVRELRVHSVILGIYGVCDVVEFYKDKIIPIEYKKGSPKPHDADEMQLLLQAMCLEEMLCQPITVGYLYYGEIRHRLKVDFTEEMKERVKAMVNEMHDYFERRYTPKVKRSKSCNACSLKELCLPQLEKAKSVNEYVQNKIEELYHEKNP